MRSAGEWHPLPGPTLAEKETTKRYYFSGTPLTFGEMSRKLPGGIWDRRLIPAIPVNARSDEKRFIPDADKAVVCVTSLARMAIFRALSHQSLHTNLPEHQRRTGWRYDGDMPTYLATAALLDNISRLKSVKIPLYSTVIAISRDAAPFEPFERERHQFRTYQEVPFETAEVSTVTLDDWPEGVEECPPWPEGFDLSSYKPYVPENEDFLAEVCARGTGSWY